MDNRKQGSVNVKHSFKLIWGEFINSKLMVDVFFILNKSWDYYDSITFLVFYIINNS